MLSTASNDRQRFFQAYEILEDAVWIADHEYRLLFMNAAAETMYGFQRREAVGQAIDDLFGIEVPGRSRQEIRPLVEKEGRWRGEAVHITRDGRRLAVDWSLQRLDLPEFAPFATMAISRDVSDRKRAEEALQISQREMQLSLEATTDAIWKWNFKTNEMFFSPRYYTMLGYSPDDFLGNFETWKNLIHPDDFEHVLRVMKKYLPRKPDHYKNTFRARTASGEFRWMLMRGTVVERDERRAAVRMIGTLEDINERRLAKGALRDSENKFRALVEQSSDIIFLTNRSGQPVYVSPSMKTILGYEPREVIGKPMRVFIASSETLQEIRKALNKNRQGQSVDFLDVTLPNREGQLFVFDGHSMPVFQGKKFVGAQVVLHDITDRKRAEDTLRDSEERYRLLVENSNDIIWTFDQSSGNFTFVSQAFRRILGYTVEEARGLSLDDIFSPEAKRQVLAAFRQIAAGEDAHDRVVVEAQHRHKNGGSVWLEINSAPLKDDLGKPVGITGISRDVTERRRAETALRRSESELSLRDQINQIFLTVADDRMYQQVLQVILNALDSPYGLFGYIDENSRLVLASMTEDVSEECQMPGKTWIFPLETWGGLWGKALKEQRTLYANEELHVPQGHISLQRALAVPIVHKGSSIGIFVVANRANDYGPTDALRLESFAVTVAPILAARLQRDFQEYERKRAEEALRKSEDIFRSLIEHVADIVTVTNQEGNLQYVSPSIENVFGYKPQELIGRSGFEFVHPDDLPDALALFSTLIQDPGNSVETSIRFRHKDGSYRQLEGVANNQLHNPSVAGIVMNTRDITDRKRIEEVLREREQLYRLIADNMADTISIVDLNLRFIYVSPSVVRLRGYEADEVIGQTLQQIATPASVEGALRAFDEEMELEASGVADPSRARIMELEEYRKDGSTIWTSNIFSFLRDENGSPKGILAVSRDISVRKRAEEALIQSERNLAEAQRQTHIGSFEYDLPKDRLRWSEEMFHIFGVKTEDFHGTVEDFLCRVHPEDQARAATLREHGLDPRRGPLDMEFRIVRPEGTTRFIRMIFETLFDEKGKPLHQIGTIQDITDRKRADEEKSRLTDQLQQSQKMEAVGRLAGGVAHDFNNLLQAILGFAEILHSKIDRNDPLLHNVTEIIKAAESAAGLTKELLAFSRKQIITPKVVDLNKEVERSIKMLTRLISEDIDLVFVPETGLWRTKADTVQIDQILINLAVNSRDAMPDGGKLTIETANATLNEDYCQAHQGSVPGDYVMLAVSDTGCGIEKEMLPKIFDPFFTTKEKEKGSGLGLSTVYGIVKQHGGFVCVDSEPGEGTTFRVYLPKVDEQTEHIADQSIKRPLTGTETVFLVEDEDRVRQLAKKILESKGYRVLEAENGGQALSRSEQYAGEIHLLLTDVVMPIMNGSQLASRLTTMRPGIKVVFMSGYTDDAIAHRGVLDPGIFFLPKPFKVVEMLQKVRDALDATPPRLETPKAGIVLLIDVDESSRGLIPLFLEEEKLQVLIAETGEEGLRLFRKQAGEIDLVLLGQGLLDASAMEIFRKLRDLQGEVPIVIVSGFGSADISHFLKQHRKIGFLPKPFKRTDLLAAIKNATHKWS